MDDDGGLDDARSRWPEFVAARWSSLEAVALAATLDAGTARRLTVDAFRDVRRRWGRTVDEGSPTAAVRRALLTRVAAMSADRRTPVDPVLADAVADEDDAVRAALLDALADETPLVRAATTATLLWDLSPDEVTALLPRRATASLVGSGRVRDRLLAAHRDALARDGRDPQDHRFDDDLAALLRVLADIPGEPPDPAGTVEDAGGSGPGRRLAVVGAVGAAALMGTGWLVLGRDRPAPLARPVPRPTRSVASPDSPLWRSIGQWPARGALAADPAITALVASSPGSRLLWAEDLHGARMVAATDPTVDLGPDMTGVRWWRGPAGAPAEQLGVVFADRAMVAAAHSAAIGCRLPSGDSIVVVLGRPRAPDAEISLLVDPIPDGRIRRLWFPLPVSGGIGSTVLAQALGPASRLRFDEYDGGLPTAVEDSEARLDGLDLRSDVAAATGVPKERLVVSAEVRALPVDVTIAGSDRLFVAVRWVRLPSGALVRSVSIGDREDRMSFPASGAQVFPAAEASGPVVVPFFDDDGGRERHIVVVPRTARTVRAEAAVYSSATPQTVRVEGGIAILDLGGSPEVGTRDLRLRVEGDGATVLHDGLVVQGRSLFDLWPEEPSVTF